MEGGNVNSINLNAGLDTKSSDMLVPVSQATFQHNWQKFQGKYLANSLRYEQNGWAAGNNIYNFEYITIRKNVDNLWVSLKKESFYHYTLDVYPSKESMTLLASFPVVYSTVSLTNNVTVLDDNTLQIMLAGKPVKIIAATDASGNRTFTTNPTFYTIKSVLNSNRSYSLTVSDPDSTYSFEFEFLNSSSLQGDQVTDTYFTSLYEGKYSWDKYTYDTATGKITTPTGEVVSVLTYGNNSISFAYDHVITNESFSVGFTLEYNIIALNNLRLTYQGNPFKLKLISTLCSDKVSTVKYNEFKLEYASRSNIGAGESAILIMSLPVWFTMACQVDVVGDKQYADNIEDVQFASNYIVNAVEASCLSDGTSKDEKLKLYNIDGYFSGSYVMAPERARVQNALTQATMFVDFTFPFTEIYEGEDCVTLDKSVCPYRFNKISVGSFLNCTRDLGSAEPTTWQPFRYVYKFINLNDSVTGKSEDWQYMNINYTQVNGVIHREGLQDETVITCDVNELKGSLVRFSMLRSLFFYNNDLNVNDFNTYNNRVTLIHKNTPSSYKDAIRYYLDTWVLSYFGTGARNSAMVTMYNMKDVKWHHDKTYLKLNKALITPGWEYTPDISQWLSMVPNEPFKKINTTGFVDSLSDMEALESQCKGMPEWDTVDALSLTGNTPSIYKDDQDPIDMLSITSVWNGYIENDHRKLSTLFPRGYYNGGSYLEVATNLSTNAKFWPFQYVPCFNAKIYVLEQNENGKWVPVVDQKATEDANKNNGPNSTTKVVYQTKVVKKIYAIDWDKWSQYGNNGYTRDDIFITDLDTFKKSVLGTYDSGEMPRKYKLCTTSNASRTRYVHKFTTAFKDYDGTDTIYWEDWYPNITKPDEFFKDMTVNPPKMSWDNLGSDWTDIQTVVHDDAYTANFVKKSIAGVVIKVQDTPVLTGENDEDGMPIKKQQRYRISVPLNQNLLFIYKDNEYELDNQIGLYQHNIDVTKSYTSSQDISEGYLKGELPFQVLVHKKGEIKVTGGYWNRKYSRYKENEYKTIYDKIMILAPGYFGKTLGDDPTVDAKAIVRGAESVSAGFELLVNQTPNTYTGTATVETKPLIYLKGGTATIDYKVKQGTNTNKLWYTHIQATIINGNGSLDIKGAQSNELRSNSGSVIETQAFEDKSGIYHAICLRSYVAIKLKMKQQGKENDIDNNYEQYIDIDNVLNSEIPSQYSGKIWLDRAINNLSLNQVETLLDNNTGTVIDSENDKLGYMAWPLSYKEVKDEDLPSGSSLLSNFGFFYVGTVIDSTTGEAKNDAITVKCIPGVAFGDMTESKGNMGFEHLAPFNIAYITWTPESYTVPTSVTYNYKIVDSNNDINHSYYKSLYSYMTNIVKAELGSFNSNNKTIAVNIIAGTNSQYKTIPLTFDCANQALSFSGNKELINVNDYTITATKIEKKEGQSIYTVSLNLTLHFTNNHADICKVITPGYTLQGFADNEASVKYDNRTIALNIVGLTTGKATDEVKLRKGTLGNIYSISASVGMTLNAYFKGVVGGGLDNNGNISFTYNGKDYTVNMNDYREVSTTNLAVTSTDITTQKTQTIGQIEGDNEYQLIKQQWNSTIDVENYWWIDSNHILELDQYNFTLKKKLDEVDDWNGDKFAVVYNIKRSSVITTSSSLYFVTNTYNVSKGYNALLIIGTIINDVTFRLTCYDPLANLKSIGYIDLVLKQRDIGTALNASTMQGSSPILNSYNSLNSYDLLSQATFSNTIVNSMLIVGVHLNNNLDQWAVLYDLATKKVTKVIQGYGYVGLHGDLTGGQIPNDFFSKDIGFNTAILSLDSLKGKNVSQGKDIDAQYEVGTTNIGSLNQIESKCVGTASQQWYLGTTIDNIVSHLIYNGKGGYTVECIPLRNNYSAVYKSASFVSSLIGDTGIVANSFSTLFNFGSFQSLWEIFVNVCGAPALYSVNTRMSNLIYLQQTFGQYAYVHYTSNQDQPEQDMKGKGMGDTTVRNEATLTSEELTFDKQRFTQKGATSIAMSLGLMSNIMSGLSKSIEYVEKKQAINEEQNQSAVKDLGKKFTSNVLDNVDAILSSAIITNSNSEQGLTSRIYGNKSLDMFYSTSDKQHIHAGPGFVEHQFVAQCIAQSITDVQTEGSVNQLFLIIKAITEFQGNTLIAAEEKLVYSLEEAKRALEAGSSNSFGGQALSALAIAATAGLVLAKVALWTTEVAWKAVFSVLDTLAAGGVQVTKQALVAKHTPSPEGKHKYGEKNETFMWPCWGVVQNNNFNKEYVEACVKDIPWRLNLCCRKNYRDNSSAILNAFTMKFTAVDYSDIKKVDTKDCQLDDTNYNKWVNNHEGLVSFYKAACKGSSISVTLPSDMTQIIGVDSFLPPVAFRNENISCSDPVFTASMIHDYIIDKDWDLGMCASYGLIQWVTCKDTKLINCPPSNMVVDSSFCGVAAPYVACEIKRGLSQKYLRPYAITPSTLAINSTGYNTIMDNMMYHAFDGVSTRVVSWVGSPILNRNKSTYLYNFQVNDRFKRSNILPANSLLGNFTSQPVTAYDTIDKTFVLQTTAQDDKGLQSGVAGEDKDMLRWSIPVFTEPVSTLPAAVKTLDATPLIVKDGITSLVTGLTSANVNYKAPVSVDFTLGKNAYRVTNEYICSINVDQSIVNVIDLVPTLGLQFIGATPSEAYFYSKANRAYYTFTGQTLIKQDTWERFRAIKSGHWDFVNQEVVMPCLMTFKRLNAEIEDTDTETDNIIIPVLSGGYVSGELIPPTTTLFSDGSWYKVVSLPMGLVYQGPNRVSVNRQVYVEYMTESIKDNIGKWGKVNKEKYSSRRSYPELYKQVDKQLTKGVKGWIYNPFNLVTSALGLSDNTDCLFEWEITFCWPIEMDLLYGVDNYAVVNIVAETMTLGGKRKCRPTHVYLTKELFTRDGSYGYYSFRYQSKNGAGNRERLYIWSDQYIAISALDCEYKPITQRRAEPLTQQIDVQKLKEL